jgi:hypothetical protein
VPVLQGLQGTFHYPGITSFISASMTRTHGISPASCVVRLVAQPLVNFLPSTLILAFGGVRLVFPQAIASQATFEATPNGYFWNLPILDRRWKWRYGKLNGRFNVRRANGTIEPSTLKNAENLVRYILDAMGEGGVSVIGIPSDQFPEVAWDRVNPAEELQELCEQYGCRIILGLDNRVHIRPTGRGAILPLDGEDINLSVEFKGNVIPSTLEVLGGATIYESRLSLRAVGLDIDGQIRPIAETKIAAKLKELGGSLDSEWPTTFGSLIGQTYIDPNDQRKKRMDLLAARTFYRWYQVYKQSHKNVTDKTRFDPPGWRGDSLKSIRQILPIYSQRSVKVSDSNPDVDNSQVDIDAFLPPRVEGLFTLLHPTDPFVPPEENEYDLGFSIDEENGIVQFGEPMVRVVLNSFTEADLTLLTSYNVRRTADGAMDRFSVSQGVSPLGGGVQTISRPDLVLRYITQYDGRILKGVKSTEALLRKEMQQQLSRAARSLAPQAAGNILYRGLRPIELDGAIEQITYTIGERGTFTQASRNSEHAIRVVSYDEKRSIQRTRRLVVQERKKRGLKVS